MRIPGQARNSEDEGACIHVSDGSNLEITDTHIVLWWNSPFTCIERLRLIKNYSPNWKLTLYLK